MPLIDRRVYYSINKTYKYLSKSNKIKLKLRLLKLEKIIQEEKSTHNRRNLFAAKHIRLLCSEKKKRPGDATICVIRVQQACTCIMYIAHYVTPLFARLAGAQCILSSLSLFLSKLAIVRTTKFQYLLSRILRISSLFCLRREREREAESYISEIVHIDNVNYMRYLDTPVGHSHRKNVTLLDQLRDVTRTVS